MEFFSQAQVSTLNFKLIREMLIYTFASAYHIPDSILWQSSFWSQSSAKHFCCHSGLWAAFIHAQLVIFKLLPSPLCTMSWNNFWRCIPIFIYHMHANITRGLYIFYPIFHCGLYCRAVNITDNLCTKEGNSSIFGSKIFGL